MAPRDVCRFCHTGLCFGRGLTLRRTARKSYSSSISVSGIFPLQSVSCYQIEKRQGKAGANDGLGLTDK